MDSAAPLLRHVVWLPRGYLVPRRDGRLVIGGTVEERGFDDSMTAGGLLALLEGAWRAVPSIEELPIAETWVGFRPGSRDDAPMLGPSGIDGLVIATGHHRNGILLTPVTAAVVSTYVLSGNLPESARPFAPSRFSPAPAGGGAMIRLKINGVDEEVAASTVAELLAARGIDPGARFLAVAVNGAVVRRAVWDDAALECRRRGRDRSPVAGRLIFSVRISSMSSDPFVIAGATLPSRLFVGTAGYPNQQVMLDALAASGAELVTMSIRRISLEGYAESLVDLLGDRYRILPNTAGCVTARDAILTAELAREALETNWVKLELIGDRETALPRCRAAGARRRRAGAQGLHRAALLQRGPGQPARSSPMSAAPR